MQNVEIIDGGKSITLGDNAEVGLRFHAIWLRDNAQDDTTRAPGNGQKLIAVNTLPDDMRILKASISAKKLRLTFHPENKDIEYDIDWLIKNTYDRKAIRETGWCAEGIVLWDSALNNNIPTDTFSELKKNDTALLSWLKRFHAHGFAKITDGPVENEALMQVVDLFGYVRETNYGRHFEVRTEVNPSNLAFTGAGLQAHTDNPYRDPVPTIQVLYCLESSAAGGENMVVDGFAAAKLLYERNPKGFELLSKYCARFEYAGEEGVILRARKPMIELAPDGQLIGMRFNNRSTASITDVPYEHMEAYYAAYRELAAIIDDEAMEVTFRLNPGECFVVDNTRVLHARKAYSGTGTRWLQGCYADLDALNSKRHYLHQKFGAAQQ